MKKKKIVIIGGGISGLTSGIYAKLNGYDAVIYEKNHNAGGMCVSWYRKGYKLDGCIHWLTGTNENTFLYKLWTDVGGFNNKDDLIYLDNWGHFEYEDTNITLWCDLKKLEEELISKFPSDKKMIKKFIKLIKLTGDTPTPLNKPLELLNIFKLIKLGFKMVPYLPSYIYTTTRSCEYFAKKFKSKAMQNLIINAQPGYGNLFSMLYSFATICSGNGMIPKGGSDALIKGMLNRYLSLGGEIKYSEPVTKIVIENKKAIGVKTTKQEFVYGDYVICALDPHFVFNRLIDEKYFDNGFKRKYKNISKYHSPSCYMAYFALPIDIINKYFNNGSYNFRCKLPFIVSEKVIRNLNIRSFSYDETFIKNGQCVIEVLIDQFNEDYHYWDLLYHDKENYVKVKEDIANKIKDNIVLNYPETKDKITYLDSFSPATLNYEVGAYNGSYMSFMLTHNVGLSVHDGKVKKLPNVVLSGQWTQAPGGLPLALATGRFAIQRILKKEGKKKLKFN